MIKKIIIYAYLIVNEPGWALVLAAMVTCLSLGLLGAYLSGVWGILAFIGALCSGCLVNGVFESIDMMQEINNVPEKFRKNKS
jgi:ribose/xylose/arabinose/galactoside ABC-type transport system permease subunit